MLNVSALIVYLVLINQLDRSLDLRKSIIYTMTGPYLLLLCKKITSSCFDVNEGQLNKLVFVFTILVRIMSISKVYGPVTELKKKQSNKLIVFLFISRIFTLW